MMNKLFDLKLTTVIGWTFLVLAVVGGILAANGSFGPQSKEEKGIEQHFESLSENEKFDTCFYFTTTPSAEIAREGTNNGWTVEETYDIVIPKMDELCGFDAR